LQNDCFFDEEVQNLPSVNLDDELVHADAMISEVFSEKVATDSFDFEKEEAAKFAALKEKRQAAATEVDVSLYYNATTGVTNWTLLGKVLDKSYEQYIVIITAIKAAEDRQNELKAARVAAEEAKLGQEVMKYLSDYEYTPVHPPYYTKEGGINLPYLDSLDFDGYISAVEAIILDIYPDFFDAASTSPASAHVANPASDTVPDPEISPEISTAPAPAVEIAPPAPIKAKAGATATAAVPPMFVAPSSAPVPASILKKVSGVGIEQSFKAAAAKKRVRFALSASHARTRTPVSIVVTAAAPASKKRKRDLLDDYFIFKADISASKRHCTGDREFTCPAEDSAAPAAPARAPRKRVTFASPIATAAKPFSVSTATTATAAAPSKKRARDLLDEAVALPVSKRPCAVEKEFAYPALPHVPTPANSDTAMDMEIDNAGADAMEVESCPPVDVAVNNDAAVTTAPTKKSNKRKAPIKPAQAAVHENAWAGRLRTRKPANYKA
jgi:hypothetical protein